MDDGEVNWVGGGGRGEGAPTLAWREEKGRVRERKVERRVRKEREERMGVRGVKRERVEWRQGAGKGLGEEGEGPGGGAVSLQAKLKVP